MTRTESTISPSPITIRKAHRDGGDWLYIYLRSNVSQRIDVDEVSGEEQALYTYDETHIRVPLPDADVDVPAGHSANQDALKAQLKRLCISDAAFRTNLANALDEAQLVDWRDRVSEWTGTPSVPIEDERSWAEALCVVLAPQDVSVIQTDVVGEFWRLIDIGTVASLWRINARVDLLLDLHDELWAMAPSGTFGALVVVGDPDGEMLLEWAVRDATGMTLEQAIARRDRIADYLDNLGHDTTQLRNASNEAEQMLGIVDALGYTEAQLWAAMVE